MTASYTPLFGAIIHISQSKNPLIWFLLGHLLGSFQLTNLNLNTYILVDLGSITHLHPYEIGDCNIPQLKTIIIDLVITTNSKLKHHAHIATISNKSHSRAYIFTQFLLPQFHSTSSRIHHFRSWNTPRNTGTRLPANQLMIMNTYSHFTSRIPALKHLSYSERPF